MAIKGSLKEASLPDVLQLLAMGKKTGCLSVTHRNNFGSIYFERGKISYASIVNRRDRLGDILMKGGLLSPEQLDTAIAMQGKERGKRLGELLVEQGFITREDLHAQMRLQIEEAVYFLFTWTEGSFNFEAEIRPEEQDFVVSINPESLLLEGARRVDEWSLIEKKVPTFDLVFELDQRRLTESGVQLTAEQQLLVPLIDGRRDVTTIIDASGLVEFEVGKALYGLATAGFLHRVGKSKAPEAIAADVRIEEHRNLGVAFYKTGMLDEAVREFRRVAELRPDDPAARFFLGLSKLRLGRWADALTHFEVAARQRGAKAAVFHNLALTLERLGRYDEASSALEQALALGGDQDARVHLSLGVLALRAGNFEAADAHFQTARPLFGKRPPSPAWFHYAALAAGLQGSPARAVELLREAVQLHTHSAVLANNLGALLESQGAFDEARAALQRGVQEDAGLAPLHKNLGDLDYRAGQFETALESYQRAVKHHETLGADVWVRIGNIKLKQGERLDAVAAWERALALDPSNSIVQTNLAAVRGQG